MKVEFSQIELDDSYIETEEFKEYCAAMDKAVEEETVYNAKMGGTTSNT